MGIEMTEQQMLILAGAFLAGLVLGVIIMLISRKVGGHSSPKELKQEMEDYQAQVETHFDETSQKFKDMAVQYQDLYTHLSKGATSLCRTENIAPLLTAEKNPLQQDYALDNKSKGAVTEPEKKEAKKAQDKTAKNSADTAKTPTAKVVKSSEAETSKGESNKA